MIQKLTKKHKIIISCSVVACFISYFCISNSQARSKLIRQLEMGDPSLKIKAATEMSDFYFGKAALIEALANAVKDYDESVRRAAIDSLVALDRNEAVKILNGCLSSGDDGIRMDVTEALERIGSKSALATLDKAENKTNKRYERARMRDVVSQMRNEYEREKEKKYKKHRRAYDERKY